MNLEFPGMEAVAKAVAAGDEKRHSMLWPLSFSPSQRTLRFLSEGGNRFRRRFGGRGSPQTPFRGLRYFRLIPGSGRLVLQPHHGARIEVSPRQRIAVGTEPSSRIRDSCAGISNHRRRKIRPRIRPIVAELDSRLSGAREKCMAGARFSLANDRVRDSNVDHLGCFADGVSHFAFRKRPFAVGLAQIVGSSMPAICAANPQTGNWLTMEMNGLYHIGTLVPFAEGSRDLAKHGGGMPSQNR